MPAGFNKGQIEYIKTIAQVNGHKTYKPTTNASQSHAAISGEPATCDNVAKFAIWCLGTKPLVRPTGTITNATDLVQDATLQSLNVYHVPINENHSAADESERVTPECFLESISMKMRHITNLDQSIGAQSHKEFRLVVFRHREKQSSVAQLAENHSNPLYDMFHGAGNYKYGPKGYRQKINDQGNINYYNYGGYVATSSRDRMLTDAINSEDYIVMKDCRYYLGREYGGKHIYEDKFFWDFEDPISTDSAYLDEVDNNKNYCWYIFILGSNNGVGSTTAIDNLGYIEFNANTHVTSG